MFKFCHFSAHSLSTKKFEIIKFKWLNTKLLELISIVSLDCRADIFSYMVRCGNRRLTFWEISICLNFTSLTRNDEKSDF